MSQEAADFHVSGQPLDSSFKNWPGKEEPEPEDEEEEEAEEELELPDEEGELPSDTEEEEPEVDELPSVEDELDTVDDAADSIDRQKAEIMQEVFGRDQDSSDAKKYSKFLDKQKPEKITLCMRNM